MDDDCVLTRLGRIDALGREGAESVELLAELRGLLRDVEAQARERAAPDDREEVVGRLRKAQHGT
jgi:hypothetical protein